MSTYKYIHTTFFFPDPGYYIRTKRAEGEMNGSPLQTRNDLPYKPGRFVLGVVSGVIRRREWKEKVLGKMTGIGVHIGVIWKPSVETP